MNFPADIQLFSYAIFLPTIIKAINPAWSSLYVQALTIPCFAWSTIVYFIAAFVSDATQHRAVFGILGALASIMGHVMLIAGQGVAVPYLGCFFIATGLFVVSGIALVWLSTNSPRYGKRTTAVGMDLMLGNSAGIAAPYVRFLCLFFFSLTLPRDYVSMKTFCHRTDGWMDKLTGNPQ